jgi:hypothetical protein
MSDENPTGDAGASITERIERLISPEAEQTQDAPAQESQGTDEQETPDVQAEEQPASDETTEADEPQIRLTDLASLLGVEEDALDVDEEGNPFFKTKIDGKEGTAKFADLVKSYQLQGHVDAKARQAAEQERALQERVQQFESHAQAEMQRYEQLAQVANHVLMQDFGQINWQELAYNDPAAYVAKKAEFEARQGQVNQLFNAVQQRGQELQQSQQATYQQKLAKAAERITSEVPGWESGNDIDVSIGNFARENGFVDTPAILAEYPQAAKILWEAMQYRQGKQNASVAEKKVRTAPKLVKPGQSVGAKERQAEGVRGLKEQIRKSGGKSGIAEYLMRTGKV